MTLIKANPAAEVSQAFEHVKPGTYPMRIIAVKDRNPEKNDLEIKLEHTTPATELYAINGEQVKGKASTLFDYIMLNFDKQWKLRQVAEAVGLEWGDFDSDDLLGKEVNVVIKLEEYNGEMRNKVARYVK